MNDEKIWAISLVAILVMFLALLGLCWTAGSKESDPEVYRRYVEDMKQQGRDPNGAPLESFEDSIYWP